MTKISRRTFTLSAIAGSMLSASSLLGRASNQSNTPARLDGNYTIYDKRPVLDDQSLRFGAYDPWGDFGSDARVKTEALFLPWEDVDLSSLELANAYAAERGRDLLISVEPWSWDRNWRVTTAELRRRILNGTYDANMREIARRAGAMTQPVVIRFAQEMEDRTGRFSWSNWEPKDFIQAWQRLMRIVRAEAPKARIMWSPKGLPGLEEYYPGDDQTDLIGLSVFGLDRYDELAYGGPRSFMESLKQGYDLVAPFRKEIWVAELGYEGGDGYVQQWMNDVAQRREEFPALTQIVYFNDKEVNPWPLDMGLPDWRVVREASL